MPELFILGMSLAVLHFSVSFLRDASISRVRQQLFRVREMIYDRIIAGELTLEDKNVRSLVNYVHTVMYAISHWSVIEMMIRVARSSPDKGPPEWTKDDRLINESREALAATVQGVFWSSFYLKAVVLVAIPFCAVLKHLGRIRAWKVSLEEYLATSFA